MKQLVRWCGRIALMLLFLHPAAVQAGGETIWVVSPQGPFTTIQEALEKASDGDSILVKGGVYRGPLIVKKTIYLVGEDWPVIDGGGDGMVVSLAGEYVSLSRYRP